MAKQFFRWHCAAAGPLCGEIDNDSNWTGAAGRLIKEEQCTHAKHESGQIPTKRHSTTIASSKSFAIVAITDVSTLFFGMTLNLSIMAVALPYFMGRVNRAARYAQAGIILQTIGWVCLLWSSTHERGGWADHLLSAIAMGSVSSGMVFNAMAFQLWYGRKASARVPAAIAVLMTIGYSIGFSNYPFRVGWANGLLALQIATIIAPLCRAPQVTVGRWRWLLLICLTVQMLVLAGRAVLGAFYTAEFPNFFGPYLVNRVFALSSNAMMMMSVVAILLAHRDEAARELERLATQDGLTGALNRRAWIQKAEVALASSLRYKQPLAEASQCVCTIPTP
eukprot:gene5618-6478_t